jgi:hypothetical protein
MLDRLKATSAYAAARRAKGRLERLAFERGDFEDTGDRVLRAELELEHPDHLEYEASAWGWLRRALRRCRIEPDDVFLDLGSGKGRVVWQAAQYPFARVIGVEISPRLNTIARANIDRNRNRLTCNRVEFITADAADYEIPDDVTYAYLYSPFGGETFQRVLANLIASHDRRPRRMTLIYANPDLDQQIVGTGRFERTHVLKGWRPDVDEGSWVHLYRVTDRRADPPGHKQLARR